MSRPLTKQGIASAAAMGTHSCNCIGPQDGKPLCPCQMRGVEIKNGRYVKTIDYGPVREPVPPLRYRATGGSNDA